MNATAFKALADALDRQFQEPKHKAKILPPVVANEPLPELLITGPINRVMELEGKRYAVDFVQGLGASIRSPKVVAKAIADLTRYAVQQPASVASGVKIVIDMLKGGVMAALRRTTTVRGRPMKPLDLVTICDQCGTSRAHGNHDKCSRARRIAMAELRARQK
ncbi:MAG: hypothetical protein GAK37_00316 [Pseudomonas sp.]|nr:MAG: hypothetical protein GAK37_00316 [Pseudomonas sp.]